MKVKTKHAVRVKRGKEQVTLAPGAEADLPKEVAQDLVDRGAAEAVSGPAPAEPEEEPGAEPGG
ncbi:MAG: hypothetical protein HZA24_00420 [Nitrospirae bacterium]|nr:hypothetical protein [Nitrospirota bacterium]